MTLIASTVIVQVMTTELTLSQEVGQKDCTINVGSLGYSSAPSSQTGQRQNLMLCKQKDHGHLAVFNFPQCQNLDKRICHFSQEVFIQKMKTLLRGIYDLMSLMLQSSTWYSLWPGDKKSANQQVLAVTMQC